MCRVHVRSGRYSECNRSNNGSCDIRVTASKFRRLSKERDSLLKRVDNTRSATVLAQDALIAAQEQYNQAFIKEIRLRK